MPRVTRFPTRASTAERMGDFTRHLRENGVPVGMPETELALRSMAMVDIGRPEELRMALKAICAGDSETHGRFDDLFDAYWHNSGHTRQEHRRTHDHKPDKSSFSNLSRFMSQQDTGETGDTDTPDNDNHGEADSDGEGKLVSTEVVNNDKKDLREFLLPEDQAAAERAARRIAAAIRYRRSRRRKAARKGDMIDLRRIIRRSVSSGGEPMQLLRKRRPDRPVHLVAILDVSGSMTLYARVFLAFLRGLIDVDQRADAFLFHTSLMCVSDALRDSDTLRAVNRLSMMAQGFGGGTRIGHCLEQFTSQYAGRMLGRRSVVIIMSDGYDSGGSEKVGPALEKLKRRGCKLVWLNPLIGWKDYAPVAASMAAAMPYLDRFAPCNTLESLAALEEDLETL
ncbi:MAG: VWA domain-containing protein [Pseudomonadota bacterium]|nr:VWA domain-containing protein [Pseudomonadota bacterium]